MVEIRRGFDGAGAADRLPWLEPVEDEDGGDYHADQPGGYGGVILAAIGVLLAIAVATAGVVWYRHHLAATEDLGQIIRAPSDPYKIRPADPGGMKPNSNEAGAYGTSTGQDIDSPLDLSALPEAPVTKPGARPAPAGAAPGAPPAAPASAPVASTAVPGQPSPAPAAAVPAPVAVKPAPTARVAPPAPVPIPQPTVSAPPPADAVATRTGPSATIQLGAFSTSAKADQVWKALSGRFAYLRGLEKQIVPVESDGKTLYRLRASGPGAAGLCGRLRVAGETCSGV